MRKNVQQISFFIIPLLVFYSVTIYLIATYQMKLDFTSFYSSLQALMQGENPYRNIIASYLPTTQLTSTNLNPPIFLMLFGILPFFNYSSALFIWAALSSVLGIIGAGIAFYYAFPSWFFKKNYVNLYLCYFSFFPTIMNSVIMQTGALLLFFIMAGYHYYLNQKDYLAGVLWGTIIAIKLFPALLFIFVLKQKRYKVFFMMLTLSIALSIIPLGAYGLTIYKQYSFMMYQVLWYGDSWNASIYGFIFRLFGDPHSIKNLTYINAASVLIILLFFISYFQNIGSSNDQSVTHQSFCLTLIFMLLMSPLGWLYYFPILIFPLALSGSTLLAQPIQSVKTALWFLCLICIDFPLGYVKPQHIASCFSRLSFYSIYFYGLLFLTYFFLKKRKDCYAVNLEPRHDFFPVVLIIFIFGVLVPTWGLILRFLNP